MAAAGHREKPHLQAELGVFSAADALQWARSSKLTGRLEFQRPEDRITLLFDRGRLIYAEAQDGRAAFGRHLFAEGLVDEVDLAAATVYGRDNQKRLGAVMVELGILPKSRVKPELHRHTLNLASVPLVWTEGTVVARRSNSEIMPVVMTEPVDPTHLLMEAARRMDEAGVIRKRLPHDDLLLSRSGDGAATAVSARLRRVLELLADPTPLGELYDRIGGSFFEYLESVYHLVERSLVEVAGKRRAQPALESRGASQED